MKQQLNLRVSDLTTHQLKELMELWGTSKTETITLIIDRAYKAAQAGEKAGRE